MLPALHHTIDQVGPLQDFHVLGNGGFADIEWLCQFANGCAPLREAYQDRSAGTVGKGEEDLVKLRVRWHHLIQ